MNAPDRPRRAGRARRARRFIVDNWIIHLTLIVLAALFVFPFIWMLGMSLKTDEEATSTTTLPDVPTFRASSPYVIEPEEVARPAGLDRATWNELYPRLKTEARTMLANTSLPAGTRESDADALRSASAIEAIRLATGRLSETAWANPIVAAQSLLSELPSLLVGTEVNSLMQDRLGRFELGGIQVRSLAGHVVPINNSGTMWSIVSGDGELVTSAPGTQILRYRFANPSASPIVIRATFDARAKPEELHRLLVSYKGDASWHHIDAELQLGDRRYVSRQTTYVAQHRGASLLLQPPTFQDDTLAPRNWVSLARVQSISANEPTRATLTLTIKPSSTARAVWGKFERNYARAFRSVPFWTYVGNSVIVVLLSLSGALFSSAFVGYAFARLNWPGRSIAFGLLLATMMLPAQVTMIPTFLIWRALGWYNTLNPLWIGAWFGNAFFIFLMVQHMRTIPRELDEAARIDGLSALQTWWYIILPQVKPTLAAIAILTFMGAWNEFMGPLIMLRDQAKFPLSLGLFSMRLDAGADWPLIMAGNLLMTLPVIVIFFLFQRYFIEGVTVTGMKG